jgi:hypothetical protein
MMVRSFDMIDNSLRRLAGWAAYLSGVAHIAATITLVGLLVAGEPFRSMNDLALSVFAAALLPVAFVLYQVLRPGSPKLALLATLLGLAGMVTLIGFSLLLITGAIQFDQFSGVFFIANGLIGVWLVVTGLIARADPTVPRRLTWLTIAAGVGQLLYVPAIILVPVWAIWLGRLLVSGKWPPAPPRPE